MGSQRQTTGTHSPATIQQHQSLCWFCSLSSFQSGCFFFFLIFCLLLGFILRGLGKCWQSLNSICSHRWKAPVGGKGKKIQELVGNWESLPYNYNKNTQMWVASTARESAGVSIVMVNSQRGGVFVPRSGGHLHNGRALVSNGKRKVRKLARHPSSFCQAESRHAVGRLPLIKH